MFYYNNCTYVNIVLGLQVNRQSHWNAVYDNTAYHQGNAYQSHNNNQLYSSYPQQYDASITSEYTTTQSDPSAPLEVFSLFGTLWEVYKTEEGYEYYLDSISKHSQWDDPRTHGLQHYNDTEQVDQVESAETIVTTDKAFVKPKTRSPRKASRVEPRRLAATEIEDLSETDTNSPTPNKKISKISTAASGRYSRRRMESRSPTESDIDTLETMTPSPRKKRDKSKKFLGSENQFSSLREHNDSPIDLEVIDSDVHIQTKGNRKEGDRKIKSVRSESRSPMNDLIETVSERTRSNAARHVNDQEVSNSSQRVSKLSSQSYPDDDDSMILEESKHRSMSTKTSKHQSRSPSLLFGATAVDEEYDPAAEEESESLFQVVQATRKQSRPQNGLQNTTHNVSNPFRGGEEPEFGVEGPDDSASDVDAGKSMPTETSDDDNVNNNINNKSRNRTANDNKMYSKKTTKSSNGKVSSTNSNLNTSSSKQQVSNWSDCNDESENAVSDWDEASDAEKVSHITGPLGNIEETIVEQSKPEQKKPNKLSNNSTSIESKTSKTILPPKNIDESKLQKNKLFLGGKDGSYGNGGNVLKVDTKEEKVEMVNDVKITSMGEIKESIQSNSGIVDPVKRAPSTESSEVRLEKYVSMLKSGTNIRDIRRQMESAGESKEMIKEMMRTADNLSESDSIRASLEGVSKSTESAVFSKEAVDALKSDPVLGKYAKMAGMGIPAGSISQKMKIDGVPEDKSSILLQAMGLVPAPEVVESPRPLMMRTSSNRRPSVPLLKMHWNTLPPEKLSNSVWASSVDDESLDDIEELEKLFGSQQSSESVSGKVTKEDEKLKLLLLEPKRAQNVIIGLTQFKSFGSHDDLLGAICAMNSVDGKLTLDKLGNIQSLIPTPSEFKKIHQAIGSKNPAEIFFLLACEYYPQLPKRLNSFIICSNFNDIFSTLLEKMNKLIDSCNEVFTYI
jgi:hypothetical protein